MKEIKRSWLSRVSVPHDLIALLMGSRPILSRAALFIAGLPRIGRDVI